MVRALIFDYNQVLANDLEVHREAFRKAFEKYDLHFEKEELLRILHKTRQQKIDYLKERNLLPENHEKMFREKEEEFLKIANTKNLLFPGTEKALKKLSKKYQLAVFTGTNLEQMFIPEKTLKLFKAIVTIKDYSRPKPDPEGLQKCIALLKAKPEECAYIGDDPKDMVTAKSAGCKAVGITTGIYSAEELRKAGADIIIGRLEELTEKEL